MPALSKAQFRYMQGVANGSIKSASLSPEKAAALHGKEAKIRVGAERVIKSVPAAPPVASPVGRGGRAPEAGRGVGGVPPAVGEHGPGTGGPVPLAAGPVEAPRTLAPGVASTERQGVAIPATLAEEVAPPATPIPSYALIKTRHDHDSRRSRRLSLERGCRVSVAELVTEAVAAYLVAHKR